MCTISLFQKKLVYKWTTYIQKILQKKQGCENITYKRPDHENNTSVVSGKLLRGQSVEEHRKPKTDLCMIHVVTINKFPSDTFMPS